MQPLQVPKSNYRRFNQVYHLVSMMLIDGYANPEELRLCKVAAEALGYEPEFVDELAQSISEKFSLGNSAFENKQRMDFILSLSH